MYIYLYLICIFPRRTLNAPVVLWPGSPPMVLPVLAIHLSTYIYIYISRE